LLGVKKRRQIRQKLGQFLLDETPDRLVIDAGVPMHKDVSKCDDARQI
jgi:hypothetical protein